MDGYYGEPVADTPPSIWWRLYRDDVPVGYRQQVAGTELYSTDGYCWKGGRIAFDRDVIQSDIRDKRNERIFHLDRITFKRHGTSKLEQAIALVDAEVGTLLWFYRSGELHHIEHVSGPGFPRAERRIESMLGQPEWVEKAEEAMTLYREGRPLTLHDMVRFSASGILGGGVAFGLSYAAVQGVGPLTVFLGAFVAQTVMFARETRTGEMYGRRWLTRLAVAAGALGIPVLGLVWALAHNVAGATYEAGVLPIVAVACGVAVAIATLLAGDLVAWRKGGYSGECRSR